MTLGSVRLGPVWVDFRETRNVNGGRAFRYPSPAFDRSRRPPPGWRLRVREPDDYSIVPRIAAARGSAAVWSVIAKARGFSRSSSARSDARASRATDIVPRSWM